MKRMKATRTTLVAIAAALLTFGCDGDPMQPQADAAIQPCGEGTVLVDGVCMVDPMDEDDPIAEARKPLVDRIAITRFANRTEGPVMVGHELKVQAVFEVVGDAFEADALVGLRAGERACTVGPLRIAHDPGDMRDAPRTYAMNKGLYVPPLCDIVAGQPDIEAFIAFDVPSSTDWPERNGGEAPDLGALTDLPTLAQASALDTAACAGCDFGLEVEASPGKDAQLLSVGLSSSVIILPVPVHEAPAYAQDELDTAGEDIAPADLPDGLPPQWASIPTDPHLEITTEFRVLGLDYQEALGDEQLFLTYDLRPIIPAELEDVTDRTEWEPLFRERLPAPEGGMPPPRPTRRGDEDPARRASREDPVPSMVGPQSKVKAAPVFVEGLTRQLMMPHGEWGAFDEFELRVCLRPRFASDRVPPNGDVNPFASNNCARLPVLVLRRFFGPEGRVVPPGPRGEAPGQYNQANIDLYNNPISYAVDEGGFEADVWMENGSYYNDEGGNRWTYGGFAMPDTAAAWFDAGTYVDITVFGTTVTLAEAYAVLIDNLESDDLIAAHLELFLIDYIPAITYDWPDGIISLQDIFDLIEDAGGEEYTSEYTLEQELLGKEVETDCGTVTAAVSAYLALGLDADETGFTKTTVEASGSPCEDYAAATVDGVCFRMVELGGARSFAQAKSECEALGWQIAPVRSADDLAMIDSLTADPAIIGVEFDTTDGRFENSAAGALGVSPVPYTSWNPDFPVPGHRYVKLAPNGRMVSATAGMVGTRVACAANDIGDSLGGTDLNLVIQPHVEAGLEASLGWEWSETTTLTLTMTLALLDLGLPFTTTLGIEYYRTGGGAVNLGQSIAATLSALSGELTYLLKWKVCTTIIFEFCSEGEHEGTVAEWDGIELGTWYLLDLSTDIFTF